MQTTATNPVLGGPFGGLALVQCHPMVYLRALGLAGLFLFFVLWTLLMRAAGRRLLRAWGVLQEASVRFLRYMAARVLEQHPAVRRRRLDQLAGLVRLLPDKITCSPTRLGREGLTGQWLVPPPRLHTMRPWCTTFTAAATSSARRRPTAC